MQAVKTGMRVVAGQLRQLLAGGARQKERQGAVNVDALAHVVRVEQGAFGVEIRPGAGALWVAFHAAGDVFVARFLAVSRGLQPPAD